ncbi:MAG: hypothetical protein J7L54_04980 [Elusimicrobia bacterium]|nr:hypothetical protein [Elusimicrobiota bacterium]
MLILQGSFLNFGELGLGGIGIGLCGVLWFQLGQTAEELGESGGFWYLLSIGSFYEAYVLFKSASADREEARRMEREMSGILFYRDNRLGFGFPTIRVIRRIEHKNIFAARNTSISEVKLCLLSARF